MSGAFLNGPGHKSIELYNASAVQRRIAYRSKLNLVVRFLGNQDQRPRQSKYNIGPATRGRRRRLRTPPAVARCGSGVPRLDLTSGQHGGDAEPAIGPSLDRERSVVDLDDAPVYCHPQTDAGLIRAHPFRAALERLGTGGDQFGRQYFPGVLHHEFDAAVTRFGAHQHSAPVMQIMADRVVQEVDGQLQQQSTGADGGASPPSYRRRTRRFSARGSRVSIASSRSRDKSTGSLVKNL